ncbi:hypothetical protein BC940DRAFT_293196 [Gongronella butleri]|nr:hypothetical protein BC940DRAFT_293196 [Gongronella butleri]
MSQAMRGKRHILQSIDYVLYCYITYMYFLDGSFLFLIMRLFLQLQLLSSSSLYHRSLHASMLICSLICGLSLIYHAVSLPGQPGIIIDFIGNYAAPSRRQLCLLDITLLMFQFLRTCVLYQITNDIVRSSPASDREAALMMIRIPPVLASALGQRTPFGLMIPQQQRAQGAPDTNSTNTSSQDEFFFENDLVLDISALDFVQLIKHRRGQAPADDETMILPI